MHLDCQVTLRERSIISGLAGCDASFFSLVFNPFNQPFDVDSSDQGRDWDSVTTTNTCWFCERSASVCLLLHPILFVVGPSIARDLPIRRVSTDTLITTGRLRIDRRGQTTVPLRRYSCSFVQVPFFYPYSTSFIPYQCYLGGLLLR